MDQPHEPDEKPQLPPEEVARRKRQLWLVAGLMVLGFCVMSIVLLAVFGLFGGEIRSLILGR